MSEGTLLDTCALLWLVEGADFAPDALEHVYAAARDRALWVSPVSAWEVGVLAADGLLVLSMPVKAWFDAVLDLPGVGLAGLTPEIFIESSFLPGAPPGDIADRLLAASARAYAFTLVTRDEALLSYAGEGHMRALAC